MNLKTRYAEEVIDRLEEAQDVGFHYAFWEEESMTWPLHKSSFTFFDTYGEVNKHWANETMFDDTPIWEEQPVFYFKRIGELIDLIKLTNGLINEHDMNRNNLENLTEEMKALGLGEQEIKQMEEQMLKNLPEFQVRTHIPGNKGVVDAVIFFKQSNQSENYYLNKFHVTLNKAKQLEEGQKYVILTPRTEGEDLKPIIRKFDSPYEAVAFFKTVQQKSELVVGHMGGPNNDKLVVDYLLANRENGKETYVAKEFNKTYRAPVQDQTYFVEKGRGFTVPQAANMIQGRSVYRDDLLNIGGQPYNAWMRLDMDGAKDRHGNYMMNQYNDPLYGYHIDKVLDQYNIKEAADPAQKEALIQTLKNGDRPLITTELNGEIVKLHLEAVPRYQQVNFYQENGKPEKREQFEKAAEKAEAMTVGKGKEKATAKQEGQGIGM